MKAARIAVKFTNEGVISIYMNEVKTSKGNSEISITVADCGIGMDEEILEKIFDKYAQGDTNISRH